MSLQKNGAIHLTQVVSIRFAPSNILRIETGELRTTIILKNGAELIVEETLEEVFQMSDEITRQLIKETKHD